MTCFNPITLYFPKAKPIDFPKWTEQEQKSHNKAKFYPRKGYYSIEVPCGHCLGCRLDHADTWATRISIEAKNWQKNCFITLTYNNPNLPKNGTLVKKDIQDFLKRLRYYHKGWESWDNPKNSKREAPIRYFCCGEYGPKGGRPHYHMALFNYRPDDLKFYKLNHRGDILYTSAELQKIWGKGFVIIGELEPESASYIARYVQKKAGIAPKTRIYKWKADGTRELRKRKQDKIDEFILMSTGVGIGRKWWEENKEFVKKWGYIPLKIDGKVKTKAIPRYFKKLWEKEDWEDYHMHRYENIKKSIENMEKILKSEEYPNTTGIFELDKEIRWRMHLEKVERGLKERAKTLKRNNFI